MFLIVNYVIFTDINMQGGEISQSIVASIRDLLSGMDKGPAKHPIILLQMLHTAFPRFAERGTGGTFVQQVIYFCCWLY